MMRERKDFVRFRLSYKETRTIQFTCVLKVSDVESLRFCFSSLGYFNSGPVSQKEANDSLIHLKDEN